MTPGGLQQAIGSHWHMAVHALASRRSCQVVCVRGHLLRLTIFLVTLEAGLVRTHQRFQLIISPLLCRTSIILLLVHTMTRETGHLAPLKAGVLEKRRIFTSVDANHAIGPERMVKEFLVSFQRIDRYRILLSTGVQQVSMCCQVISRAKLITMLAPNMQTPVFGQIRSAIRTMTKHGN